MTALAIPPSVTTTDEDPNLNLGDECYCGGDQPIGVVSWSNVETGWGDWIDVCAACLPRAVDRAWDTARDVRGEGVHLVVLPDSERTTT